jgi:hypothetical protein
VEGAEVGVRGMGEGKERAGEGDGRQPCSLLGVCLASLAGNAAFFSTDSLFDIWVNGQKF